MGFKAATIFVSEREPGYFGKLPAHDPSKARALVRTLGLRFDSARQSTFLDEFWPERGTFSLGAYEGGLILADQDYLSDCVLNPDQPVVRKLLAEFPNALILCISLHSVVNHWGYALYERGQLLRRFGGDSDSGITANVGTIQPEEKPFFDRARTISPTRMVFTVDDGGETSDYQEDQIGESLVFAMASRCLGQPLNYCKPVDLVDLKLELFLKNPTVQAPRAGLFAPQRNPHQSPGERHTPKSWWKFW